MSSFKRQPGFLRDVFKEANRYKRQELLERANADQINAVSEMTLNLLRQNIPVKPKTYQNLKRYKQVLREIGKKKNSVKRRRKLLMKQTGAGLWRGLNECYKVCHCRK